MTLEFSHIINGKAQASAAHFDVLNPSTGGVVGKAPRATAADVAAAIAAAKAAFPAWAAQPDPARQDALRAMAKVIEANAEELARLLTLEQGKPLAGLGSRFEVGACIGWLMNTAGLMLEEETIQNDAAAHIIVQSKPIGVVAAISPWNWPLMIAIWQIAPAIRAGNTVVLKPSPLTPLSTLRMVELLASVLPPGVLNCIGALDDVAPILSSHPDISKVSFTGSTATGKRVMAAASDTLKRLTLELGGNDAAIILPDVDPAAIAEGLFWGAFINNGQTCACLKRLYVHDDVYDAVCASLTAVLKAIPMGDGLDEANVMGPVQNAAQFNKVREMVDDAVAKGGKVLIGGKASGGPGYFYPLTLVAEATHGMRLVDEEQFGPALPIIRYSDIDAVIAIANATTMGLGASVWSGNAVRAAALVRRLESGTAWVNSHGGLNPNAPFGGVKQSGFGVEFGADGLREFTVRQTVFLR
ncbi:MAG: aldehyde dehydrogenase family protein [Pseudomonadota bacterium]